MGPELDCTLDWTLDLALAMQALQLQHTRLTKEKSAIQQFGTCTDPCFAGTG